MIFEKAKKQIQVVQGDITGTASAWHSVLPASGRQYTSLRKLFAGGLLCVSLRKRRRDLQG